MTGGVVSEADRDEMVAAVRELHEAGATAAIGGVPTRRIVDETGWTMKCVKRHLTMDDRVGSRTGVDAHGPMLTWVPVRDGRDESTDGTDEHLIADGGDGDDDAWTCDGCGEGYNEHARVGDVCVWCDAGTDPQLVTDGGSGVGARLDELATVGGHTLGMDDTVEHVTFGPLTVTQRAQMATETVRIRFVAELTVDEVPTLYVEYTMTEIREQWGDTIHADPVLLYEGGADDD